MDQFKVSVRFSISLMLVVTALHLTCATSQAQELRVPVAHDGVQRAEVILDSYAFTPNRLIVKKDVPVEFILKNVAWVVPHSFVLKAPEAGLQIESDLQPSETVSVLFTPRRAGTFKFFCDKKLLFFKSHEERGMVGTLEVTE